MTDLTLMRGMTLNDLEIDGTAVTDLTPLTDLPLKRLKCDAPAARIAPWLRAIKSLEAINGKRAAEFWKDVVAKSKQE